MYACSVLPPAAGPLMPWTGCTLCGSVSAAQSLVHTDKSALLRLEGEVGGVSRSSCMDKKHLEEGAQNPPLGG